MTQSHSDGCIGECCHVLEQTKPHQPSNKSIINATRQEVGKKARYFNPSWYKDFSWINFCTTRSKIFCFYCLQSYARGLLTMTKKYDGAFIVEGFSNWKKARERLERHQVSECRREAMLKYKSLQAPSVRQQLISQVSEAQRMRRDAFLKQLSSLKFLLRQGLAIRGHTEHDGNLIQLLQHRSEDSPDLTKWLENHQYLSHDIVNEIIKLMGNTVLRKLLGKIREVQWYSIMADETRDISGNEQLAITIRWVNEMYEVQEDLIGMVHVESTTASSLTLLIKDVLVRCILPLDNCRGQAYDGAANMMGHLRGVGTQIESKYPLAIKVHCFAHCLNLCLQEASKNCLPIRTALNVITDLSQFIRNSPKRSVLFQKWKQAISPEGTGLRPLCPTRWTVRTGAIDAVLRNYTAILSTLDQVSEESHDEYGWKASGLTAHLKKFDTYIGLKMSHLIFSATEQTSVMLQGKNTSLQEALNCVEMATGYLKKLRSDESFDRFYKATVEEAKTYTDDPTLPRCRRLPRRFDDGAAPHSFSSPEEYYRSHWFYSIDLVVEEISDQFTQSSISITKEIEALLITAANLEDTHIVVPDTIKSKYSADINIPRLELQLGMLLNLTSTYAQSQNLRRVTVTSIRTIADMMVAVPMAKNMLPEIDKLLRIYLTIPITTCTAERCFSMLRCVKTYLRSTMTEERLNNILLLHTHKEETDALDLIHIANLFASANDRRKEFFGNFK